MTLHASFQGCAGDFAYDIALAAEHELLVLYGHSGAGKTMALRSIAGLARPDSGTIEIGGRTVFDSAAGIDQPPQQRRTGYVVQEVALFPHLSVERNVLIGVEGSTEARARWGRLRDALHLGGLDNRRPHELSGGQQQRVALARALVRPVDVLLLDEPFSALDDALRADLRTELKRLQREFAVPVVFVTHDLREAHLLADSVAVIDDGRILQLAPRDEVFRRPGARRVAELTGVRNLFAATASGDRVTVEGLELRLPANGLSGPVDLGIRSERCNLRRFDPDEPPPPNCFVGRLVEDLAFGNTHTLRFEPDGVGPRIEVEVAARPYEVLDVPSRNRWVIELPPDDLLVMPQS
ncbi:MAG: ABC transporter ATP-binding protein [Chloroflexi bacterium]|nr:ABC transporter ATP-binding protein [Chloroflexota bacterium]MDA1146668.1 ABC transporter ATP-binding protein [Chloroflexota bacterium]